MKTVFVDVDTQLDFLLPTGALYVPGAERLVPAIARLNRLAVARQIPLISTTDAHGEDDPEFQNWPPHCVAGTTGQHKPGETLIGNRAVLRMDHAAGIELAPQIIVEKQAFDAFTNPNYGMLLDRLAADRYVVYGVATEYCVRCAAQGLRATGRPVALVADVIAAVNPDEGARMLRDFVAQGGTLITAAELELCYRAAPV